MCGRYEFEEISRGSRRRSCVKGDFDEIDFHEDYGCAPDSDVPDRQQ